MEEKFWWKNYDEGVPTSIDYGETTLNDFLANAVRDFPERTALIFEGAKMTYRQLFEQVKRFATAMADLGMKKGDRVAIQLPNTPQFVIAFYGIQYLGGTVVMTNPMYVQRELEHILVDSEAKFMILLDSFWVNKVRPMLDKTKLEKIVVTSFNDYLPFPKNFLFPFVPAAKKAGLVVKVPSEPNVFWFKELLKKYPATPPENNVTKDELATFQYTGGTTGLPKAAMLTQGNLAANAMQVAAWMSTAVRGDEVNISALPFFHSFGLTVCMNLGIYFAGTMVLIPDPRNIKHLVESMAKYKATLFPAVPALYTAVNNYKDIQNYDISTVKACVSGAAPLPEEVQRQFESITGGKISEGFGLSEASPVTHANPLYGMRKVGSIGVPMPDTDAKIMDLEEGLQEMPQGESGELVLRGPQVMKGYWNKPEETANTLRDGWLYTGDIAQIDEDGFFFIVGRKKDMIIAGGYNIYPREIDEILYMNPKVLEAAAVGIPDPRRGETVKAYVVLKEGETATEEEIANWCKDHLAPYKVPKAYEFREELPKSNVGKVLRRILREEEVAKQKNQG